MCNVIQFYVKYFIPCILEMGDGSYRVDFSIYWFTLLRQVQIKATTIWHWVSQSNQSLQEDKAEKISPIMFAFIELPVFILLEHDMTLCLASK